MTQLKQIIEETINKQSSISISQYMDLCLSHPEYGYYQTQTIFGSKGDFITSPEISQIFGELLAIWAILIWQAMGTPNEFIFCEIGAGRGTLMSDMLRTIEKLAPGFFNTANIVIVETSKQLIHQQQELLHKFNCNIKWHNNLTALPQLPLILVANELLDALSFKQYSLKNGCFYERKITLDKNCDLIFTIDPNITNLVLPKELLNFYKTLNDNVIIEYSEPRLQLTKLIYKHISKNNGAALLIDYGELKPCFGDSFQSVYKGKFNNVFANIGKADLTSHVDFYSLAVEGFKHNCQCFGTTQSDFLRRMGILQRADILSKNISHKNTIQKQVQRLIDENSMGKIFKAFGIFGQNINNVGFTIEDKYEKKR